MKDKPSQSKNTQVRESRSMYTSISLAYLLKKLLKKMEKSEWVVRWSSRSEDLKDKKRGGSPEVLNNTVQIVLRKERYKRNPTR